MPIGAAGTELGFYNNDFRRAKRTEELSPRALFCAPSQANGRLQATQDARDPSHTPRGAPGSSAVNPTDNHRTTNLSLYL